MPTISTFYGILIRMFFNDHAPPHFHARYGEFEATFDIETREIRLAALPRKHRAGEDRAIALSGAFQCIGT